MIFLFMTSLFISSFLNLKYATTRLISEIERRKNGERPQTHSGAHKRAPRDRHKGPADPVPLQQGRQDTPGAPARGPRQRDPNHRAVHRRVCRPDCCGAQRPWFRHSSDYIHTLST